MMEQPLLSVVIPVYNADRYLDECVESVANQTYNNLEIIIVDDGSTDKSPEKCEEWAKKDSRIKIVHKKNAGLGFARNTGIEAAKGEYITFLDSDDFIRLDTYAEMLELLLSNNADCIKYGKTYYYKGRDCVFEEKNDLRIIDTKKDILELAALIFESYPSKSELPLHIDASCCWGIFDLKILKGYNILFPSERELLSEDYVFHFNYLMHCNKVLLSSRVFYYYRVNSQSLSRKEDFTRLKRAENLCVNIKSRMKEEGYKEDLVNHVYSYYVSILLITLKSILNSNNKNKEKLNLYNNLTNTIFYQEVIDSFNIERLNFYHKKLYNILYSKDYSKFKYYKFYLIVSKIFDKILRLCHNDN